MLTEWRIVAQGRLELAEVRQAERGSFYSVVTTRGIYSGVALSAAMLVYLVIQHQKGEPVPFPLIMVST